MSGSLQDLKNQESPDVRIIADVARLRLKDQSEEVARNNYNRSESESEATGDEDGKQVPSTPEPIDRVPKFETNMMGLLNVKDAKSAKTLWEGFMFPFRGPEAEENEWSFAHLMNEAYPHAIFHPRIFDVCYRIENNVRTYAFLGEVPEFIDWWKVAHVRPPAKKSSSVLKRPEQQAETEQLHPGFYGLCYWLVSLRNAPPEPSPEGHRRVKMPPKASSEGHHHVKRPERQAKPKLQYPASIESRNQSVDQTTVPPKASSEGYHHVERSDPSDVPADDDVHMEDVTSENAYLDLDWDAIDAVEASFGD